MERTFVIPCGFPSKPSRSSVPFNMNTFKQAPWNYKNIYEYIHLIKFNYSYYWWHVILLFVSDSFKIARCEKQSIWLVYVYK